MKLTNYTAEDLQLIKAQGFCVYPDDEEIMRWLSQSEMFEHIFRVYYPYNKQLVYVVSGRHRDVGAVIKWLIPSLGKLRQLIEISEGRIRFCGEANNSNYEDGKLHLTSGVDARILSKSVKDAEIIKLEDVIACYRPKLKDWIANLVEHDYIEEFIKYTSNSGAKYFTVKSNGKIYDCLLLLGRTSSITITCQGQAVNIFSPEFDDVLSKIELLSEF